MSGSNESRELIESAASYAGNLYNGLDKIVALLREDKTREGLGLFAQATEGLEWLIKAIAVINANSGGELEFDVEAMNSFLSEMVEAAENMDYVLLTDLIEYEILPIIDEWGNTLDNELEKQ